MGRRGGVFVGEGQRGRSRDKKGQKDKKGQERGVQSAVEDAVVDAGRGIALSIRPDRRREKKRVSFGCEGIKRRRRRCFLEKAAKCRNTVREKGTERESPTEKGRRKAKGWQRKQKRLDLEGTCNFEAIGRPRCRREEQTMMM